MTLTHRSNQEKSAVVVVAMVVKCATENTWAKEYMRLVLKDLGADHEWITWHSRALFTSVMIDLGTVGVGEFGMGVLGRNDAIIIMK